MDGAARFDKPGPQQNPGSRRSRLAARDMPRWYLLVTIVASILVLSICGVGYTTYVDGKRASAEREADRNWCTLLTTLDEAYSSAPPTTELGRRVAKAIRDLRLRLDC